MPETVRHGDQAVWLDGDGNLRFAELRPDEADFIVPPLSVIDLIAVPQGTLLVTVAGDVYLLRGSGRDDFEIRHQVRGV